mmetsp:Transcript_11393/g.26789  ORF Transcript_11393/g.26789 Transcript_11393/m.26789 type:complete len:110 (-) Transcript_11393:689-1018(-)|eukprot:CAMPEP_0172384196 /NCGR_PEP_ID=MMETSP1061-20121228/1992_1 /TAXON_ID=37318 /ORGANISM="Pseudo-nitzschia pungens, Strain cf. pungens" /LENGTH=109 /DNA_ID=CAMNT_0013112739 /DNA_START=196 /DNA_END=525 /DNA_ORIENTATION=-
MNKFVAFLFIALAVVQGTVAFTTTTTSGPNTKATTLSQQLSTPVAEMPSYYHAQSSSTTALNLKVKVDPNAKTNNSAGNAKAAAYGGSIAVAALLPIIFLVWSALNKGN